MGVGALLLDQGVARLRQPGGGPLVVPDHLVEGGVASVEQVGELRGERGDGRGGRDLLLVGHSEIGVEPGQLLVKGPGLGVEGGQLGLEPGDRGGARLGGGDPHPGGIARGLHLLRRAGTGPSRAGASRAW